MSETDFDPAAFARRLEDERRDMGWTLEELQERLERVTDDGVRGTSYGSVWSYVNGLAPDRGPRPEVVEGLAELFGHDVRPEYLLYGGPRTETEAALQQDDEPGPWDLLRAEIPELKELDYTVQAALMNYMHRWIKAHLRAEYEVTIEEAVEHTVSVWHYMHEPLRAWSKRIGKQVSVSRSGASDYMMAMLHALNLSLQVAAPPGVSYEDIQGWPDVVTDSTPEQEDG